MVVLNESNIVLITTCYIRNCEKNCVPNIISINPTRFKIKLTLKMKVFQIGLQMTLDKFPYGGGRKLLASMLQSSGTPPPLPLPTPTLPLSSANARSLGSKTRIKTQNPTKDLKLAMQREKES